MNRKQQKEYNAENYSANVLSWLNEITDIMYDNFEQELQIAAGRGTCKTCKFWVFANKEKTLKKCAGDNGCALVGENFFCANYEKKK